MWDCDYRVMCKYCGHWGTKPGGVRHCCRCKPDASGCRISDDMGKPTVYWSQNPLARCGRNNQIKLMNSSIRAWYERFVYQTYRDSNYRIFPEISHVKNGDWKGFGDWLQKASREELVDLALKYKHKYKSR